MQSLLKKHEALENDFAVHKNRVQDVCAQGEDILSKVSSGGLCSLLKVIGPSIEIRTVMKLSIGSHEIELYRDSFDT